MSQERNVRNGIIVALCITVLCMGVGFAYMAQNLTINGVANVEDSTFDPQIIAITPGTPVGGATDNASITKVANTLTANFGVNLVAPGDSLTYTVTIKNAGTIPFDIESVEELESNTTTEGIQFTNTSNSIIGTTLEAGQETTMTVTSTYLASATQLATPGTYKYGLTVVCNQHVA